MGNFLEELKRRRVYRVTAIYTVVAWVVIQAADVILPTFNSPQLINQALILGLLAGLPVVVILAWTFQITNDGVQKQQPLADNELVSMRKRDYFFGALVSVLIVMLIAQQGVLFNATKVDLANRTDIESANNDLLVQMEDLIENDEVVAAYLLGLEFDFHNTEDVGRQQIWEEFTTHGSILSEPEAAKIWIRDPKNLETDWILVGETPLAEFPLPSSYFQLKLESGQHPDYEVVTRSPNSRFGNFRANQVPIPFVLPPASLAENMVHVPTARFPVAINGFARLPVVLGNFLMDKFEVTNREFKEFVDQQGYQTESYWNGLEFREEGLLLGRDAALARFVDSTGRPGPAGWELGDYPDQEANYPVTGISWYEAVAYAQFRGKALPTAYHWARAAFARGGVNAGFVELSNFGGSSAAVGSTQAMGPYGALDMAGNVREWTWNDTGENKAVYGGSWDDPDYMAALPFDLPPMTRDSFTGFRLAQYLDGEGLSDSLFEPVDVVSVDFTDLTPVSDEVYEVLLESYRYDSTNLNPTIEKVSEETLDWTEEKIYLNTDYDSDRFAVYLLKPKTPGPHEAVIFFGGLGLFYRNRPSETYPLEQMDYIMKSGRALVFPVYWGSFERYAGLFELDPTGVEFEELSRLLTHRWRSDLGRTLDYLETRDDLITQEGFDYFGRSYGASVATPLIAIEERIKTAVLVIGGFPYIRLPSSVEPLNFASRITQPVLMLNGRYDNLFPVETQQLPFFNLLGTPATDKQIIHYDMGHQLPPRNELVKEMINWFDKY
ncbi:MAG: SUMF1/EgtB/PvdO family nonheme iron enzyme [Gammaproteobacteria bacterium]|nr:SUMF1/EgtB/PvdO family nonheme iron enzyme [Gammaproteobacteria bacterium]